MVTKSQSLGKCSKSTFCFLLLLSHTGISMNLSIFIISIGLPLSVRNMSRHFVGQRAMCTGLNKSFFPCHSWAKNQFYGTCEVNWCRHYVTISFHLYIIGSNLLPEADQGFSWRGSANSQSGCANLLFCRKLHENERICTPRGGMPCASGSATGYGIILVFFISISWSLRNSFVRNYIGTHLQWCHRSQTCWLWYFPLH